MKLTKLLTTLLAVCELMVVGCAGIQRPNTDLCVLNAPNKNRKCYNMSTDYADDGSLKPGAKAVYRPNATVEELNKALVVDSPTGYEDGLVNLKIYIKTLRQEYENCKNPQVRKFNDNMPNVPVNPAFYDNMPSMPVDPNFHDEMPTVNPTAI